MRWGDAGPGTIGAVMSLACELDGQPFMALNGGPAFTFSEAISLSVRCESQEEADRLWEKLIEGGKAQQCGWQKDRYGLSWQIVPDALERMMQDSDPARS